MHSVQFNTVTWNQGTKSDFRNMILRKGDKKMQDVYQKIKPLYEAELVTFNKLNANELCPLPYWMHPEFKVSLEEKAIISDLHEKIISNVYKKLFECCSIICLQELNSETEIQFLENNLHPNFDLLYGKFWDEKMKTARTDSVVIWDKTRFTKIEPINNVTSNRRTAHVTLFENTTKKIIQVVSCHFEGFNLTNPSLKMTSSGDASTMVAKRFESDYNCFKDKKIDIVIIAGDFNAVYNPEYLKNLSGINPQSYHMSQNRFEILQEHDYEHIQNDIPTSYNKDLAKVSGYESGECILDYYMVKSICSSSKKIFINPDYMFGNIDQNPSDHTPLFMNIEF